MSKFRLFLARLMAAQETTQAARDFITGHDETVQTRQQFDAIVHGDWGFVRRMEQLWHAGLTDLSANDEAQPPA